MCTETDPKIQNYLLPHSDISFFTNTCMFAQIWVLDREEKNKKISFAK